MVAGEGVRSLIQGLTAQLEGAAMSADALSPTAPPTGTLSIPGPRGVPLLGNLPAFAKDPLGFLTGLRSRGDIVE
jgi:hypothetical protein